MNRIALIILLTFQLYLLGTAQNNDVLEIQADIIDSTTNSEVQAFYEKFNSWVKSQHEGSNSTNLKSERMINEFILFSEDGLIMKDLNFHSVESCKKQILSNLPNSEKGENDNDWIYVSLESHVNKIELIEILTFLKMKNIDYYFGVEDDFVPKIIGN